MVLLLLKMIAVNMLAASVKGGKTHRSKKVKERKSQLRLKGSLLLLKLKIGPANFVVGCAAPVSDCIVTCESAARQLRRAHD